MNPKRVLIVNIQSLLIDGIASLLKTDGNFMIVSSDANDLATLVREIEHYVPDVILMDEDTYFVEPAGLLAALWNIPKIRLIVLDIQRIPVNVFDKYERAITHPSQLMDVIGMTPHLADIK